MDRPSMAPTVSTRVIYRPHLMASPTPIAPPAHSKALLKCRVTKQIFTGRKASIKAISRHQFLPHQIQQLVRLLKLIKRPQLRAGKF